LFENPIRGWTARLEWRGLPLTAIGAVLGGQSFVALGVLSEVSTVSLKYYQELQNLDGHSSVGSRRDIKDLDYWIGKVRIV